MAAIVVTGLKEVDRMLTALGDKQAKQVVRAAMKFAARPVKQAAERTIPLGKKSESKGGQPHLRSNIVIRMTRRSRNRIGVVVAQKGGDYQGLTYYGSFVELGHYIGKRTAEMRTDRSHRKGRGTTLSGGRKWVPGKWYMRKAGIQSEQQAQDLFQRHLLQWLNTIA